MINDLALLRCFMRGKISVQFAECLIREGQVGAFVDFAQNSVRVLDPFMEIDVDGLCFRKNIAVAHASFQKAAIPIYPVPGLFFRIDAFAQYSGRIKTHGDCGSDGTDGIAMRDEDRKSTRLNSSQ